MINYNLGALDLMLWPRFEWFYYEIFTAQTDSTEGSYFDFLSFGRDADIKDEDQIAKPVNAKELDR